MRDPSPSMVLATRECIARGLTIATAESLTGGLVAAAIASVPGCSASFRGGVIAYAADVKHDLLGVDGDALGHVVSAAVAEGLARGATRVLRADLGIGTTGVAGPDPLDGQPPGTVWIALADARTGGSSVRELRLTGDRDEIRESTVAACGELLMSFLESGAAGGE